jgi:dehypoxanthine futalosine cyclase
MEHQRISFEEGVDLLKFASLDELKSKANAFRFELNPKKEVTFVLDSNPNYTNVCNADCSFCAFYRKPSAKDSYTKTVEQVLEHFEIARKAGLTTVLLQGGLNDDLKIEYYEELVRAVRKYYPDLYPHLFSAPELWNVARVSHLTIEETLKRLWNAGLRSIPGGGAEIISERIRLSISPKKMEPGAWIDVHQTAHRLGYRTTATMMYGHVEEPEDIVNHLEEVRNLQDLYGGFTAFIPWSYKRDRTALRRRVDSWVGDHAYLRIIAFARLYLDNVAHIQASWFSEGRDVGMEALHSGADDFGGIVFEENVHKATGFVHKANHNDVLEMIREAGFEPVQRSMLYQILRRYAPGEIVDLPLSQIEGTSIPRQLSVIGK